MSADTKTANRPMTKPVLLFILLLCAVALILFWLIYGSTSIPAHPDVPVLVPVQKPSPVGCPVSKPALLPFTESLESINTLQRTPENLSALRWLLWDTTYNETVRNEAAKMLRSWNADWFVADVLQLLQDPAQSAMWRGWCVQYLERHYRDHKDKESMDGMFAAATREDMAPAVQALFSLAVLCRDLEWKNADPDRFNAFQTVICAQLPKLQPPDPKDAQIKDKSTVAEALLDAASQGELRDLAPTVEQIAGDTKWTVGVRVAAVKSLMLIGRKDSLPVLQKCMAETNHPMLVKFATMAITCLDKK